MNLEDLRRDYQQQPLLEQEVHANPIEQFEEWMKIAIQAQTPEPNAMTLSTVNPQGQPTGRIVLLKEVVDAGFIFYTNYNSRKGQDLAFNPKAGLTFHWVELARQIRIEGEISKISEEQSTEYFHSRPKGSQIGAVVSPQSQPIPSREFLEERQKNIEQQYAGKTEVQKPEDWGGYILEPNRIEFWQGRSSRLHDRIVYEREGQLWQTKRLAP